MRSGKLLIALAPVVALVACQDPDVGAPCTIGWGSGSPPTPAELYATGSAEYVEFNNPACENLVCVLSPAAPGSKYASGSYAASGYCSKPCVSNRDCYESDTDLICRNVVLDETFLAQLSPETRERYLADVEFSSYCGVPLE